MPAKPAPEPIVIGTAVEMDDALRAKAVAKVHELFGEDVEIEEHVNPIIVGGIVIKGRGRRYDASVRAQLATIRTKLASTFMGGDE